MSPDAWDRPLGGCGRGGFILAVSHPSKKAILLCISTTGSRIARLKPAWYPKRTGFYSHGHRGLDAASKCSGYVKGPTSSKFKCAGATPSVRSPIVTYPETRSHTSVCGGLKNTSWGPGTWGLENLRESPFLPLVNHTTASSSCFKRAA